MTGPLLYIVDRQRLEYLKVRSDLRCMSCPNPLKLGDVVYASKSGNGRSAKRHLECALKYNVVDTERVAVLAIKVLIEMKAMVVEIRSQQAMML